MPPNLVLDVSSVAIDASKLTAYGHSVPKSRISENNPTFPNIADMDVAESLIQKMMDDYGEEIHL